MTGPLRHGQPWGRPASGAPDLEIAGDDADLAEAVARHPGALARFRPSPESDIARAIGLQHIAAGTMEVALDALALDDVGEHGGTAAVNAVVVGRPPDRLRWMTRATRLAVTVDGRSWFAGAAPTVVIASGQYLRGADLVPRGHPGDGWVEVQVYALARNERGPMRHRLATGAHVPHPRIHTSRAQRVELETTRALPLEIDGRPRGRIRRLAVTVVPEAIRILI
jgi:YegS C-terminal NAD kinase beta sandwich-like domain